MMSLYYEPIVYTIPPEEEGMLLKTIRSEEHTFNPRSVLGFSFPVSCLKKKKNSKESATLEHIISH
ncbi:hypothetical protein E4V51_31310, partial [Paenibacillus sp. 28ISP30-2]|nr:hypothetical protein [Paenibacillus sp. 28ISP30-2]